LYIYELTPYRIQAVDNMDPFVRMTGQLFCNTATPERISVWMLLQCEHIITTRKDLSVQLAGTALLIAVARNEFMPTQGVLLKRGWACRYVVQ
jgi:hypothetical protein